MYYTDELCHHGILGMKWGVRRYQNKDGTYTDAGKKRYYKDHRESIKNDRNASIDKFNKTKRSAELSSQMDKIYDEMDALLDKQGDAEDRFFDAEDKYGEKSKQVKTAREALDNVYREIDIWHKKYEDVQNAFDKELSEYVDDVLIKKYGDVEIAIFKEGESNHWKY